MIAIDGTLKSDASVVGTKAVLFLAPWSDGSSATGNAPVRIQLDVARVHNPKALSKGTRVRVLCESLAAPTAGQHWWVATGSSVEITEQPAKPMEVTIEDPLLGTMKLDRRSNELQSDRTHGRDKFKLSVPRSSSVDDRTSDEADLARGRAFVAALEGALPRILIAVATKLLPLYNNTWRGDRDVLGATKFVACLGISSARVGDDRDIGNRVYLTDGELFWGHFIEVDLDTNMRPTSIELAG